MKDIDDSNDKRPSGIYTAEGFAVHREWDPATSKTKDDYDFGIILLELTKDGKNVGDVVDPITIDYSRENYKDGDTWETIGYPICTANPEATAMMKQTGVFVEKMGGCISKISNFGSGGSGGVWVSSKLANGVHVSSSNKYQISYSPHFTPDLMEGLKYTYFNT